MMVRRGTIEVAKTVMEVAEVALTAVECCHKYNQPHEHHDSQIDKTTPSEEEELESLRSENRRLKNLLEDNLKLLQNLSESTCLLPECPPDVRLLIHSFKLFNYVPQSTFSSNFVDYHMLNMIYSQILIIELTLECKL